MSNVDLSLTQEELEKIAAYAEGIREGNEAAPDDVATVLLSLVVAKHRLHAGDLDPAGGASVDEWSHKTIGRTCVCGG